MSDDGSYDGAKQKSVAGKIGKGAKKGVKLGAKGVTSLPGAAAGVGKGVGKGAVKGVKLGTHGVKKLPGTAVSGAKLGAKGVTYLPGATVTGVRVGATIVKKLPGLTRTGVKVAARFGITVTTALPGAAVKGVTALPGAAVQGITALPGAVKDLPQNVVTGAKLGIKDVKHAIGGKRPLVRQDSTQAWKSRMTSPVSYVDVIFECHGLPKKDSFSQADAFCVLWEAPPGYTGNSSTKGKPSRLPSRQETEIGHTEIVDNCDPIFTTTFRREFDFEKEQTYVVRVYDKDLRFATDLKEHDYLGGAVFTLGQLMGADGNTIARPLNSSGRSYLKITGKEIMETRKYFEFRFSGEELFSPHDVLDVVDPYFRIETLQDDDQTWSVIWKSEVIKANDCPTWNEARLPLQVLMGDQHENDRLLKITLWDHHKTLEHVPLGFVEVTIDDLIKGSMRGIPVYDVMREKQKIFRGSKLKKAGVVKVLKATISTAPSMLEYISGGCEVDLTIAVDFTRRNGKFIQEDSLHYRASHWLNDYQAAIHKIGTICESFSKKKQFAMLGFGAQVKGYNAQNFNKKGAGQKGGKGATSPFYFPMAERAIGADGLLKAYDNTLDNHSIIVQSKWAHVRPVIQAAVYRAIRISKKRHCYCILAILTAGEIIDISQVSADIVTAAEDAPISIVFVGVGESGQNNGGDSDDGEDDSDDEQFYKDTYTDSVNQPQVPGLAGIGVGDVVGAVGGFVGNVINGELLAAEQTTRRDNFGKIQDLCDDARGSKKYNSAKLMSSNGVPIGRNIMNFAKFEDNGFNSAKVVAQALEDIPEQMVQYFVMNGVNPRAPLPPPDFTKDTVYNSNNSNHSSSSAGGHKAMGKKL